MLDLTFLQYLEYSATFLSLTFLFLLIKENKWCWPFGIVSSLLFIYIFYQSQIYVEAVLYIYYVLIGIYGWHVWTDDKKDELQVTTWSWLKHIPIVFIGGLLSFGLGWFFKTYTDGQRTYVDATNSIFALIASYMEVHKIFSSWIFWIIVNGITIWLYWDSNLKVASGMMVVYFVVSIFGFIDWGKKSGVIGILEQG